MPKIEVLAQYLKGISKDNLYDLCNEEEITEDIVWEYISDIFPVASLTEYIQDNKKDIPYLKDLTQ